MEDSKIRSIIKFHKEEIRLGNKNSDKKTNKVNTTKTKCCNALTHYVYPFEKGSKEEVNLYRVMPYDSHDKLYFNSKEEYASYVYTKSMKKNKK